jgi:hypothetical protein
MPHCSTNTGTHLQLMKHEIAAGQDVVADQYEMRRNITADADDAVTFRVSLTARAKAGGVPSLRVRPSLAHADLQTAKIIVERLNARQGAAPRMI